GSSSVGFGTQVLLKALGHRHWVENAAEIRQRWIKAVRELAFAQQRSHGSAPGTAVGSSPAARPSTCLVRVAQSRRATDTRRAAILMRKRAAYRRRSEER